MAVATSVVTRQIGQGAPTPAAVCEIGRLGEELEKAEVNLVGAIQNLIERLEPALIPPPPVAVEEGGVEKVPTGVPLSPLGRFLNGRIIMTGRLLALVSDATARLAF